MRGVNDWLNTDDQANVELESVTAPSQSFRLTTKNIGKTACVISPNVRTVDLTLNPKTKTSRNVVDTGTTIHIADSVQSTSLVKPITVTSSEDSEGSVAPLRWKARKMKKKKLQKTSRDALRERGKKRSRQMMSSASLCSGSEANSGILMPVLKKRVKQADRPLLRVEDLDLQQERTMTFRGKTVMFTDTRANAAMVTKKPNVKLDFVNRIVELGIISDKMYNHMTATDLELRDMEMKLNPIQVKKVLQMAINQARATRKRIDIQEMIFDVAKKRLKYLDSQCRCFGVIECEHHPDNSGEDILAFGTGLMFLQGCALESSMLIDQFLAMLIRVMSRTNGKKNCIQIIGVKDSGKSSLVDLVTGFIPEYYIGNFSIPVGNSVSPFWLQDLVQKEIGRCEEAVVDREDVAQVLKAVCEGNPNLKVDVKYEEPQQIGKVPIFITLNGDTKSAMCRYISSEVENFKARCEILLFKRPMKDKISEGCIHTLKENVAWVFPAICYRLWYNVQDYLGETRSTASHILNKCVKDIISTTVHDLQ